MGTVDIFILKVLTPKKAFSLTQIIEKIRNLNLTKIPSRIAVYQRLQILSQRKMVNIEWQTNSKLYQISESGVQSILEIINTLNR